MFLFLLFCGAGVEVWVVVLVAACSYTELAALLYCSYAYSLVIPDGRSFFRLGS